MHDNRIVTSVIRGSGVTVIDNFVDASFDLKQKIMLGRRHAGDSICAPMAGVYADLLLAVEDFRKRKENNDKETEGKTRLLFFDSKGTGPCRQGQYVEVHKLLLYQTKKGNNNGDSCGTGDEKNISDFLKLMISREANGYNFGIDEWVYIQSFQGLIMQGIFNSILLKAGEVCLNIDEFDEFYNDYLQLKEDIYKRMESSLKPRKISLKLNELTGYFPPLLEVGFKALLYGVYHNNGYRKILKSFSSKWFSAERQDHNVKLKIHIDGEIYLRIAQFEDVFREIVDAIGFGSFKADCSPMWTYFELILENAIEENRQQIRLLELNLNGNAEKAKAVKTEIEHANQRIRRFESVKKILRKLFVGPLYSAAGIDMPHDIKYILKKAQALNQHLKPEGELPLYLGETINKIEEGVDLVLNVAPENCMVAAMGQALSQPIQNHTGKNSRIQDLFSLNGEINKEKLQIAVLRTVGPEKYYTKIQKQVYSF
jgi:predicted nucleotide-binding protein (sugar kinase/HSP70/actin superfamily)